MRFLAHLLIAVAVALVFGFGLSWLALTDGRWFGVTQVGPWQTWPGAGSPTPDPYSRAYIARTASLHRQLLANSQSAELFLAQGLAEIGRVAAAKG